MAFNLEEMFKVQAELDETIAKNHNVSYASTRDRRIMALLVEIGELANSTRCFKYWSNKPSECDERVLDEYADGMHFFLSLGVDISTSKKEYDFTDVIEDKTKALHEVYHLIDVFYQDQNDKNYIAAFQAFINLIKSLGYTWEQAHEAYYKKLGENYHRQETNY